MSLKNKTRSLCKRNHKGFFDSRLNKSVSIKNKALYNKD